MYYLQAIRSWHILLITDKITELQTDNKHMLLTNTVSDYRYILLTNNQTADIYNVPTIRLCTE